MVMRIGIILLFAFVIMGLGFKSLSAQESPNIKYGKIAIKDFETDALLKDSSASALIIANIGSTEFLVKSNEGRMYLSFDEFKRIKILKKTGFDIATISIPIYVNDKGLSEKLENLKAVTYNLENGKIVETKLQASELFSEKSTKNWTIKKFTFPNLKEGSIIEYSYEISSPYLFNLHSWQFQSEYPCLWSAYTTTLPDFIEYVQISQGYQTFKINSSKSEDRSMVLKLSPSGGRMPTTQGASWEQQENEASSKYNYDLSGRVTVNKWAMSDIPALKDEPYTTTINNHLAKIEFQLSKIQYPQTPAQKYMSDWKKTAEDLMGGADFGVQITRPNTWLQDDVNSIIGKASTQFEKAKKIYEFVRDNFNCNSHYAISTSALLKDTYKNKSGNIADVNLLLAAMLRVLNILADPVILSTRSNCITHEIYPLLGRFNYLIIQTTINNKVYYLDASIPHLGFGLLSSECYNGHARVITKEMASPIYFNSDSLQDASQANAIFVNDEKEGFVGTVTTNLSLVKTFETRERLLKVDTNKLVKAYFGKTDADFVVENFSIDSLSKFDDPISIKYDVKLTSFENSDLVYFNPLLEFGISKNPFSSQNRFYPVEMPYTKDCVYNLTMDIPKGYEVDEIPKSIISKLNGEEGVFEYIIKNYGDHIQMRCRLAIFQATFSNEEYEALRNFYAIIIQKESEKIVFKRRK